MQQTYPHHSAADSVDAFAFHGADGIHEERHYGIINGLLAPGIPHRSVAKIEGLWAPPWVSTDFKLHFTVNNQLLHCWDHTWWPFKIERRCLAGGFRLTSTTTLVPGRRAGLMRIRIENISSEARQVPLRCEVSGTLDRNPTWTFLPPVSSTPCTPLIEDGILSLRQTDGVSAIVVACADRALAWEIDSAHNVTGIGTCMLAAGAESTVTLAFAIGPAQSARDDALAVVNAPIAMQEAADARHRQQVVNLYERLPRLTSANAELDRWYHRSLVHLILNRWEVPEFVIQPFYGTGSIRGGCICCYIWNYGELWEILPLVDPSANRAHILQTLSSDMTQHLAWNPVNGEGVGPWYPINQEKIVGLIYFQVMIKGDKDLLSAIVNGQTVLDHVIAHALYRNDLSQPVQLVDYGPANDHLELRRSYMYHHVMPDLNARRYQQLVWAAELSALCGLPRPDLLTRANDLKKLIKDQLWNSRLQWFYFMTPTGRDVRWTNQMFKLFSSGVLDNEQEAGLLAHLNEEEFLSPFGLHSLAKQDVAYDPNDVDNGGPGSCTSFPPQIAERLYKAGKPGPASDLIRRCLWWASNMPYWSDSMLAEGMDYRHDTTLQCLVDGAAIAQCVIFGVFGISVAPNGAIHIRPRNEGLADEMTLQDVHIRGRTFTIGVVKDHFTVQEGGQNLRAAIGETIVLSP